MTMTKSTILPIEPLMAASGYTVASEFGKQLGLTRGAVEAIKTRGGVPIMRADSMAVRLGLHPLNVWGDAFFQPLHRSA